MRLLLEILLAAALIAVSWNKSFKDWASEAPVIGHYFSAPSPSPRVKSAVTATKPPTTPQSFTGHITYVDEQGKTYWLDAQGKRHYQP